LAVFSPHRTDIDGSVLSTSPNIEFPPVETGGRKRPRVQWVLLWLALATIYAVTGYVCAQISAQVGNVSSMFYIPSGISLTVSLLWGRRVWPGVFLGEIAMALATHRSIPSALIMACGNGLDAYLAGWWFRDRPGRRIEFNRLKDVLRLLAGELLILQPISAAVGMFAITRGHPLPGPLFLATATSWYSSNVYGQFVIAPAALVWTQGFPPMRRRFEGLELAVFSALILAVGAFGYGRWASNAGPAPGRGHPHFPPAGLGIHPLLPSRCGDRRVAHGPLRL
jgi:integral membrane sensor domain MASE1